MLFAAVNRLNSEQRDVQLMPGVLLSNPDFELTDKCGSPCNFDEEVKRLQDELAQVINEGRARFDEYVKSSRHEGYKTWDDFRAANPIYKPIRPE
jgi:hypothetical protein